MLVVMRMCRTELGLGHKSGSGGRRQIFDKWMVMRRRQVFWIRKATHI